MDGGLIVPSTWQGLGTEVLEAADARSGGVGWVACGQKGGRFRAATGSYMFPLRCACARAFECPAALQIEVVPALCSMDGGGDPGRVHIFEATKWAHKHVGPCRLRRGLPPNSKPAACLLHDVRSSAQVETLMGRLPGAVHGLICASFLLST